MQTETKITLESLNLKATCVPCGTGNIGEGDRNEMLRFNCLFTNAKGRSESFEYFVGFGQLNWNESRVKRASHIHFSQDQASVIELGSKRWDLRDKSLLASTALAVARITKFTPDPLEVLACIARDGDAQDTLFEDWCSEMGYDTDSRKAEKTYNACRDNFLKLRKLLSAQDCQALREMEF